MLPTSLKFLWLKLSFTVQSFYFYFTKFCFHPTGEFFFKMRDKASKRIENKKKKMAALIEISKLNEHDRNLKKQQRNGAKTSFNTTELEPTIKKPRTEADVNYDPKPANPTQSDLGPSGKPKLIGLEYQELKKMLREKTTRNRQLPVFKLRDMGSNASLTTDLDNRVPLFLSDIQHLIMYTQLGPHSPYSPARWCSMEKFNRLSSTTVFIIENLHLNHTQAHANELSFLTSTFEFKLEILAPNSSTTDIVKDLSMVPLTGTQMRKFCNEFGTLEAAVLKSSEVFDTVRNLFPISGTSTHSEGVTQTLPPTDRFPRTQLLLSGWQMVEENFPLPIRGLMEQKYNGYVLTKDRYQDVNAFSPMFGIDCEMCRTTIGDLELTRVSVVDEHMNTVYDTLVKPKNRITDYLTQFSGITYKMLKNIKTTLKDVQQDLQKLLPEDAILVGQSISNDLHALKIMHPYIIDTSIIFNLTGDRSRKTKLKTLSQEFLHEKIQEGNSGHCSTEDSTASLKLAQLKLSKSLYFGDAVMGNIQNEIRTYPELGTFNYATSMLHHITNRGNRSAAVVGLGEIGTRYKYYVNKGYQIKKDTEKIKFFTENHCKDVVKQMCRCVGTCPLNIGHIQVPREQLDTSNKIFKNIDNWCKEIYKETPARGLVVVIFTGDEGHNGCCFIQLKKEI